MLGRRTISTLVTTALMAALVVIALVPAPAASAQVSFTFTGGGWGHGVGMSQYGARGRADAGHSVTDILAAYYPTTAVESRSLAGPRVKLVDTSASDLSTSGGALVATPEGGSPVVIANPGERVSVRMFGAALIYQRVDTGPGPVNVLTNGARATLSWDAGQSVTVSAAGRSYALGSLRLIPGSSTYGIVLQGVTMEQYLYGLGEMPASWPAEALKAQAVAGRSYAAYRLAHPQSADFDLYASVSDQAYVGAAQTASSSGPNWTAAVDATAGQVLTSGGQVVQAFYSSSNGGHTERSDYVFSAALPYLVAIPDPYDQVTANPNRAWNRTYTGDELAAWLAAAGRGSVGSVTGITIGGNVGASGRVDRATVTVAGTDRTVTMTGTQFRSAVNAGAPSARDLLSTKFAAGPGTPEAPAEAPKDTTAPDLKVLMASPARFGSTGNVCAFVLSDETAIFAISLKVRGVVLRSAVGGVAPGSPQIACVNIPPKLRPRSATKVTLVGAALDVSVNLRFVTRTVTIAR